MLQTEVYKRVYIWADKQIVPHSSQEIQNSEMSEAVRASDET